MSFDVHNASPPRRMVQSGGNIQGVVRKNGRMHIYKVSPIGQDIKIVSKIGSKSYCSPVSCLVQPLSIRPQTGFGQFETCNLG